MDFLMMEKNKLGMILFIASESIFFTLLILAYAYFNSGAVSGPTADSSLDPAVTGFVSLFLWSSSFTIWRAGKNLEQGNHSRLGMWLLATIVLGILFLTGQGIEWSHLIGQGATISRNLFGTTFFTLTGFHGLHVLIGLVMLATLFGLTRAGYFKGTQSAGVTVISLYWHFVDAVWIVIFSVVYLTLVL
jgi:heme/copper-type cytochrome/quinol oxidase subunit 3